MPGQSKRRRLALGLAATALAALLLPPYVNANRFKGRLVAAMEAALGRSVRVDEIRLHLLPRPGFDLRNLVIGDDPAFSAEPMLRADEVTAALRLTSLWRGRLEIAQLSLDSPSLNLVRSPEGRWNLEALMARAAETPSAPTALPRPESRPRFPYIEAENGRINFKLGQEKKALALADADFALWLESEKEWGMRLEARPVRTDMNLGDTGELRIAGTLGRAAAPGERPLRLSVRLEKAQLGQLSALIWGRDRGWRGALDARASFAGTPNHLRLGAEAELRDFRRYDIVAGEGLRGRVRCSAAYRGASDTLSDVDCLAPVGEGDIAVRGMVGGLFGERRYDLSLAARGVPAASLAQVLRRAKRDLPGDFAAAGELNAAFTLRSSEESGLPSWAGGGSIAGLRVRSALLDPELSVPDVRFLVENPAPPKPTLRTRAARTDIVSEPRLSLQPLLMNLGGGAPVEVAGFFSASGYRVSVRGMADITRLTRVARAFGVEAPLLDASGSARVDLAAAGPWAEFAPATVTGTAQVRRVTLRLSGIAEPVEVSAADLRLSPETVELRHLALSVPAARLSLTGEASRSRNCEPGCPVRFTLHAPDIAFDELNRLLNPQVHQRRWFQFGGQREEPSVFSDLSAQGRITAGRVLIKSVAAQRVSVTARLAGGRLELEELRGELLGGRHEGVWHADFTGPQPLYSAAGRLTGIALEQVGRLMHDPWATGHVSARYELTTAGSAAPALVQSASGEVEFDWRDGAMARLLLPASPAPMRLRRFTGKLALRDGILTFPEAQLETAGGTYTVTGTASLARQLDLRLVRDEAHGFAVTGTLAAPRVAPLPVPATRAAVLP
ncbi:MAG TPA: AsmA family protein [Terriglobales bacterium]|nr:AsmA family protein [Terriglobales bacterium]